MSPEPRQPSLFQPADTETVAVPVAPAGPIEHFALFAQVAVPLAVQGVFTYGVRAADAPTIRTGVRVAVRFHGKRVVAYVVATSVAPPPEVPLARILAVTSAIETEPVFTPELLAFLREAADYYLHPFGDALRSAAPPLDARIRRGRADVLDVHESMKARWAHVREETFVRLVVAGATERPKLRGDSQARVMDILESRGEVSLAELRSQVKNPRAVIRALAQRGLIESETREVPADPFFGEAVPRDAPPTLTPAQDSAVREITEALDARTRATFLIHGVTGSGKTEVYLRAVDTVRRAERGALILVPEIALTPQLVSRYRSRFGDDLAVLHSGLKDRERYGMWRKLHTGECHVAIGARSAIFAPIRDLALIVVDEEHDGSFKQDDHFRYHGRDMAMLRAHRTNAVCVLGSATPSVETYESARSGRIRLISMPERATAARLPEIEVVDLKRFGRSGPTGHPLLSLPLVRALGETLARREQAIIFLNRRGFAPSIYCTVCDETVECKHCSVAMVLHRRSGVLKCHYCDASIPYEQSCPKCGSPEVEMVGVGTERVEHALSQAFPGARVARLDRDVAAGAGAEVVLGRLRRGEIDVLVGTQMVTKGHDIERVTLVGVLLADAALAFPDFRATERTFQLLTQVAGRAGRGSLPGRVLIQTWQPEHPVLRRVREHDYLGYFDDERQARREVGYPPFGRLIAFRIDGPDETKVRDYAERLGAFAAASTEVTKRLVNVLGPAPAPIERVRGRFRMRMLLRAVERAPLRAVAIAVRAWIADHATSTVQVAVDVDPVQML